MLKNFLIKWSSTDGTIKDGKFWLAATLLSYRYNNNMLNELTSEVIVDAVIKEYFWKYAFGMLYWWIRYGFKYNKMYWYSNK